MKTIGLTGLFFALATLTADAGVVKLGNASYSDAFPGVDAAGRNAYPAGSPQLSGKALSKPVPTNDWWSNELIADHGVSSFSYPLALKPMDAGLNIQNPVIGGGMSADTPILIGLAGLNAPQTTVADYSDWAVTFNWDNRMNATAAMGMPFVYFDKTDNSEVSITVGMGTAAAHGNILVVKGSYNGASYAVYAPSGSTWSGSGSRWTSDLNGKRYWSVAMFQPGMNVETLATEWQKYAFVFPADTRADMAYDESAGRVTATYTVTPDVKEGDGSTVLMGILPHQYNNMASQPAWTGTDYTCARGKLRTAATNSFSISLRYSGVLPTIPALQDNAADYSRAELIRLIDARLDDNGFSDWTDSYNDGQLLNAIVQTARIAKEIGYTQGFERGLDMVRQRVERWFTYGGQSEEVAFMFYYHAPYTALLGYPAGHGQDSNINDHHFHWGYFIHAAAFIEQNQPGWASKWGEMVNLLVRDAASSDRNDPMFPYLRNFSPYAGHCWANGFATDPTGNDQESTSESMQFNCSLIHWGAVTGNKAVRDLGVCLYAIERAAIEEYWFNINGASASNGHVLFSRIFGNRQDSENFWGAPIEGSYGIHVYPVHAGSFYLVNNPGYAKRLWQAMLDETRILDNAENANMWYDSWYQFLSMVDPDEAVRLYNSCTQLGKKFGISQAQTYQQVYAMSVLGVPRQDITADNPLACVFDRDGYLTYCVQNYGTTPLTVTFSDGTILTAQAGELATSRAESRNATVDIALSGSSVKQGDKVTITLAINSGDHQITRSVIKVDGNIVSTASHNGTSVPIHSTVWTAPSNTGEHTVTAEIYNTEGRTFASPAHLLTVEAEDTPDNPDNPPVATTGECVQNFEWSADDPQGFHGNYTVSYTTSGSDIIIKARFEGSYVGLVEPELWNATNGFENAGRFTSDGDQTYIYTFPAQIGIDYVFSIKIMYSGGDAFTSRYSYRLGQNCGLANSIDPDELSASLISISPNPASEQVRIKVPGCCEVEVYASTGAQMLSRTIDGIDTFDIASWAKGIYFVRVTDSRGAANVVTLIKK